MLPQDVNFWMRDKQEVEIVDFLIQVKDCVVRVCGEGLVRDCVVRVCGESVWRGCVVRDCVGGCVVRDCVGGCVVRVCGESVW